MTTESRTDETHLHTKAHDGQVTEHAVTENHKPIRKAKAISRAHAKTSKRHSNSRGSNHIVGRLAESLTLGGLATGLAEGFSEHLTDLKEKGLHSAKAVKQRIVKHPKSSVLIAFGAGYIWAKLRKWL